MSSLAVGFRRFFDSFRVQLGTQAAGAGLGAAAGLVAARPALALPIGAAALGAGAPGRWLPSAQSRDVIALTDDFLGRKPNLFLRTIDTAVSAASSLLPVNIPDLMRTRELAQIDPLATRKLHLLRNRLSDLRVGLDVTVLTGPALPFLAAYDATRTGANAVFAGYFAAVAAYYQLIAAGNRAAEVKTRMRLMNRVPNLNLALPNQTRQSES